MLERDNWFGEVGLMNQCGPMHSVGLAETLVHLMVIEKREFMRYIADKETNMLKKKLLLFSANIFADCSL